MDDWYQEGDCPVPTVYEQEKEEFVIYDSDGNPLTKKRIKMGFDLTVVEKIC